MATKQGIATALMTLGAAYRAEVEKTEATVWERALSDVPDDVLAEVVDAWVKSQPRWPRVSQLRDDAGAAIKRRRDARPALPPQRSSSEEQREINRRGIAMVRAAMRTSVRHVDDALGEEG